MNWTREQSPDETDQLQEEGDVSTGSEEEPMPARRGIPYKRTIAAVLASALVVTVAIYAVGPRITSVLFQHADPTQVIGEMSVPFLPEHLCPPENPVAFVLTQTSKGDRCIAADGSYKAPHGCWKSLIGYTYVSGTLSTCNQAHDLKIPAANEEFPYLVGPRVLKDRQEESKGPNGEIIVAKVNYTAKMYFRVSQDYRKIEFWYKFDQPGIYATSYYPFLGAHIHVGSFSFTDLGGAIVISVAGAGDIYGCWWGCRWCRHLQQLMPKQRIFSELLS